MNLPAIGRGKCSADAKKPAETEVLQGFFMRQNQRDIFGLRHECLRSEDQILHP